MKHASFSLSNPHSAVTYFSLVLHLPKYSPKNGNLTWSEPSSFLADLDSFFKTLEFTSSLQGKLPGPSTTLPPHTASLQIQGKVNTVLIYTGRIFHKCKQNAYYEETVHGPHFFCTKISLCLVPFFSPTF